jgi:hypothetical protein
MPKSDGPNEAETLAALKEKRLEAIKVAVPRLIQLNREIASKNKAKADVYANLEKRGVSVAAFKEAMKRALKEPDQLQLFDEEAAALETLIRKVTSGAASEEDRSAIATAEEAEQRKESAKKSKKAAKTATAKKQPKPKAAKTKGAGRSKADPTQGRQPDPQEGDPDFRQKIARVVPQKGAEGFSANDIPMPSAAHRPPPNVTPITQARGFVDKTPRMTAAEHRKLVGADDDDLLGRA